MPPKRGDTALAKYRGSGFEDGFADPPMTPAEAEVETLLYDPNRPFAERIETAIQRFRDRRRMTSERSVLFDKYLALGGVDTTQRQFTGTASFVKEWKDEGLTKDEIRGFTANDFLSHGDDPKGKFYNPAFPEYWEVDFAGVVAGYLGTYLPEISGSTSPEVRMATDTVRNFLRYIQHHDVCPEYRENLVEATRICERAITELPRVGASGRSMPGDFNLACRILFCCSSGIVTKTDFSPTITTTATTDFAMYEDKKDHELAPGEMVKVPGAIDSAVLAPANFDATRVFLTTLALQEPEMMERAKEMRDIRVINTYEDTYEVTKVVFAPEGFHSLYKAATAHDDALRKIGPVGYVVLFPTIIEDGWDDHPTLDQGRASNPGKPISLYLDHAVLDHLVVGMKLRLAVCETNMGLEFLKECREVLPSFHVFLPQTLMMHWKPPRLCERLPPSAEDPDREAKQMQADIEKEEKEMIKEQRKVDPELDRQMREVEDAKALEKAMEKAKI